MIRAHSERYFRTDIIVSAFTCWTVAGTVVQQSLAQCFNNHWHNCLTVAVMILQQSLPRLFNSHWHNYATVAGTILQLSLARLFNTHWHYCSTVTGTILQQWLSQFFNSHGQGFFFFLCWQKSSTVMSTVKESCHVPGIRHMIRSCFLTRGAEMVNARLRKSNYLV